MRRFFFRAGGDTHEQGAWEKETYDEEERRKAMREFFQFPRKISLSRSEYVSEEGKSKMKDSVKQAMSQIAEIHHETPIKKVNANDLSGEDIRTMLTGMNDAVKKDPSLLKDPVWRDLYDTYQKIADRRGIVCSQGFERR